MPQHCPWGAVLAGCPHWPPRWSPSSPFSLEGNKLFRGPTIICWRSLGSWKSPSQELKEAMPHSLSRCHLGARRKGRAWEYVPPGGTDGGVQSPFSSDSWRSSVFHHPTEPRTHKGAGVSDSWAECPGALPAGQAGQEWGYNPNTTQALGGEELRPASSRNNLSLHGGRNQVSLLGPRPRPWPPLFSLWFFL